MTIEEACRRIIGTAADAIISEQGLHWAVVAAMAVAKTTDNATAIKTIREWNAAQKQGAAS